MNCVPRNPQRILSRVLKRHQRARKSLDSAFMTTYDQPVAGAPRWRQRNVTLVGGGESVCVIGYAPADLWKKSKPARSLLQAVLAGVELAPWH